MAMRSTPPDQSPIVTTFRCTINASPASINLVVDNFLNAHPCPGHPEDFVSIKGKVVQGGRAEMTMECEGCIRDLEQWRREHG